MGFDSELFSARILELLQACSTRNSVLLRTRAALAWRYRFLEYRGELSLTDLADYIRTIRQQRGYSLSELASRTGLSKSELSSIENRRIKLPGVEKRRSLARALGVSHMDLLIAAGELDPAEVPVKGASVEPFVPGDPRRALYNRMLEVHWTDTRLISIIDQLDRMLELDRGHTPQVLLARMIEED